MKTLLAAVLVLLSLSVQAEDTELTKEQKLEALHLEGCQLNGLLAVEYMKMRQGGVAMSELTEFMSDSLNKALIIGAYKKPVWRAKTNKEAAISEYGSEAMLSCLESK